MGLGFTGYVLPVMPGTIFMILAALCFLRSSDRLYNKIINNPSFGGSVKSYVEEGYINKPSKYVILKMYNNFVFGLKNLKFFILILHKNTRTPFAIR